MANITMRTVITTIVGVLFNVGLTVSGIVNFPLAIVCWALMILVILAAYFWPQLLSKVGRPINGAQIEGETELEAQERWRQQEAVDKYVHQIRQWIEDENKPLLELPPGDLRCTMARTETLALLEVIGSSHKRRIMRTLKASGLIKKLASLARGPIIPLNRADLSHANLAGLNLQDTHLAFVNLSNADLTGTVFSHMGGTGEDWRKGVIAGLPIDVYFRPKDCSLLIGANLSGAVLRETELMGCVLQDADFDGADLDRADLRGADLRYARNLAQEQLDQAYGGVHQREPEQNTLLPDHFKAPASWGAHIHAQRRARYNELSA